MKSYSNYFTHSFNKSSHIWGKRLVMNQGIVRLFMCVHVFGNPYQHPDSLFPKVLIQPLGRQIGTLGSTGFEHHNLNPSEKFNYIAFLTILY